MYLGTYLFRMRYYRHCLIFLLHGMERLSLHPGEPTVAFADTKQHPVHCVATDCAISAMGKTGFKSALSGQAKNIDLTAGLRNHDRLEPVDRYLEHLESRTSTAGVNARNRAMDDSQRKNGRQSDTTNAASTQLGGICDEHTRHCRASRYRRGTDFQGSAAKDFYRMD